MIERIRDFLIRVINYIQKGTATAVQLRAGSAYSRAAVTAQIRKIDPCLPLSWEFSGFSQHGEDGIIDYLCSRMSEKNYFFLEIGAADCLQNCSAWLAYARRYAGVMIEGNPALAGVGRLALRELKAHNVELVTSFVTQENIDRLMKMCPYQDPDVFILDIDGIDYHILKKILELGFRPKLIVVEYNSSFGPDLSVTVPYDPQFSRWNFVKEGIYYGVSFSGWKNFLHQFDYHFVTVDSNGVNAFFIFPDAYPSNFVAEIRKSGFRNNLSDRNGTTNTYLDDEGDRTLPARDWKAQLKKLEAHPLLYIPESEMN